MTNPKPITFNLTGEQKAFEDLLDNFNVPYTISENKIRKIKTYYLSQDDMEMLAEEEKLQ